MSGIHDPHTLREESQWPDPFSFQIPSGPSVKVTEKPMKRAGLWTLWMWEKRFFFVSPGGVPLTKPPAAPAAPAARPAASPVPESGPGWS